MKRNLFALTAAVGFCIAVHAVPLTPDQALTRIGLQSNKTLKTAGMRLAHTAITESGVPAVYVFNNPGSEGFVVASADDLAYPLLGYSETGKFSADEMPPQLKWWLEEYARQIQFASGKDVDPVSASPRTAIRTAREAIAPQIKTKWDQVAPYNNQCPLYGTERTYTGCVATSMAQVMKYWNYPEVGKGSISYDSESLGKRLSLNFANRKFDWKNMLDIYATGQYTEEQASAVAYLMKAAGYSVKMDYDADSSGALAMNIANGLLKYFDYDPNMTYTLRAYYSASEWETMIYDNLKNVGPILYGGGSLIGGGHSFVCDGYDGNGLFHFNWGWSGMSDGYFSLDALSPQALGSGGGGGGGYNFTQDAVLGIQPPTGLPAEDRPLQITQMGSLAGVISGSTLKFDLFAEQSAMWVNYNPTTMKLQFGAIFEPQGDTQGETLFKTVSNQMFSVAPGYGTDAAHLNPTVNLSTLGLSDGTYKVTFATVPTEEENARYVPVRNCYGYYNYVILKKNGNSYTLQVEPVDRLSVKSGAILGDLYEGCATNVTVTVVNDNDIELTKGFAPALILNNELVYLGESVLLTVAPHSEVTKEWTTPFYALANMMIDGDTQMQLTFFDESSYNLFVEDFCVPVTMKPFAGKPSVSVIGEPQITGAQVVKEKVGNADRDVYLVTDNMNIPVESTVMLRSGIFGYNVYACVFEPNWNSTGSSDIPVLTYSGYPMILTENTEAVFNTSIAMPMAEEGKYYLLLMAYELDQTLQVMTGKSIVFRLADPGAVENIVEEDSAEEFVILNLQGMSLGTDWESLPAGLYIRGGKKILKK